MFQWDEKLECRSLILLSLYDEYVLNLKYYPLELSTSIVLTHPDLIFTKIIAFNFHYFVFNH